MSFIIHSGHEISSLAERQLMATWIFQLEPTKLGSKKAFSGGNCRGIQADSMLNVFSNGWNGEVIVMVWDMHAKMYRHTVILKIPVLPQIISMAVILYEHFIQILGL
jgi:hypothetical protein